MRYATARFPPGKTEPGKPAVVISFSFAFCFYLAWDWVYVHVVSVCSFLPVVVLYEKWFLHRRGRRSSSVQVDLFARVHRTIRQERRVVLFISYAKTGVSRGSERNGTTIIGIIHDFTNETPLPDVTRVRFPLRKNIEIP